MYIYMKKEESYMGHTNVHHVHITQAPSNSKIWGQNSTSIVKTLKVDECDMVLENVHILDVDYRQKGGEAFQTIGDITVDGVVYTIRFDLRVPHILRLIQSIGIGKGGYMGKTKFIYSGNQIIPMIDGVVEYEVLKKHLAKLEASKKLKADRNSGQLVKITKANTENFSKYIDFEGKEIYVFGVVSVKWSTDRFYLYIENMDESNYKNKDFLLNVLMNNEYKLEKNLALSKFVEKFYTKHSLDTILAEYNNLLYTNYEYTKEDFDIFQDKLSKTLNNSINYNSLIASFLAQPMTKSSLDSMRNVNKYRNIFSTMFDIYDTEITRIIVNWRDKNPKASPHVKVLGNYVPDVETFYGISILVCRLLLNDKQLFTNKKAMDKYVQKIDVQKFKSSVKKFFHNLEGFIYVSVSEDKKMIGVSTDIDSNYTLISKIGFSSHEILDKFEYKNLSMQKIYQYL